MLISNVSKREVEMNLSYENSKLSSLGPFSFVRDFLLNAIKFSWPIMKNGDDYELPSFSFPLLFLHFLPSVISGLSLQKNRRDRKLSERNGGGIEKKVNFIYFGWLRRENTRRENIIKLVFFRLFNQYHLY